MTDPFVESAQTRQVQIRSTSDLFAAACSNGNSAIGSGGLWFLRPLMESEIAVLQGPMCRCKCQNWSKLRLYLKHQALLVDQSFRLENLISDTTFAGVVVLGVGDDQENERDIVSTALPPGVHSNAFIANCILEPNCLVYRNTFLKNTRVCSKATVMNCGTVDAQPETSYGSRQITVGPEGGGGRTLRVTPESTMVDICRDLQMMNGGSTTERRRDLCDYNIVGPAAVVRDTPTIRNVLLASNSSIEAATSVENAVLLPRAQISNSCTVANVMLQWNASITNHSNVSDTLLMEHAHAGPQSTCVSSVLGPDVHISTGEVHASVLGPNTNAHHQSLVISVLWPLGRGNVGYGANVGSNHTGRLPDQETCAGEGTFWGLSVVIKFPVNLLQSPYSIVAAGTTLIPQRVCMPFSLMVDGKDGMSQIIPGWVLSNSPYTLLRSEQKYANRRKAQRHGHYTGYKIIRPDIVDMCIAARKALLAVSSTKDVYKTEKDIPGIGKNYVTEKARRAGIDAYAKCIQRYALCGLLHRIKQIHPLRFDAIVSVLVRDFSSLPHVESSQTTTITANVSWPMLPWDEEKDHLWNHQRRVLKEEFPMQPETKLTVELWIELLLQTLVELEKEFAQAIFQCKNRDDVRGSKTIPNYSQCHVAADEDPVIRLAQAEAQKVEDYVNALLSTNSGTNHNNSSIDTMSRL